MMQAIKELGSALHAAQKLPPVGYYRPTEKIRWVIHLYPDENMRFVIKDLKKNGLDMARPSNGRTSKSDPLPICDQASYVFGVDNNDEKNKKYLDLLKQITESGYLWLAQVAKTVQNFIESGAIKNSQEFKLMKEKEWVTFIVEKEGFNTYHVFEHDSMQKFWAEYMNRHRGIREGECSLCGKTKMLVGRMKNPKFATGTPPLHSLNSDAFVSFYDGSDVFKKAQIGICFDCSELSADALTYLSNHKEHYKYIYLDKQKRDSLKNQIAFFWVLPEKNNKQTEESNLIDLEAFVDLSLPLDSFQVDKKNDLIDESVIEQALNTPWHGKFQSGFTNDYFHLMVLSPNGSGRISPRLHISKNMGLLRNNIQNYSSACMIIDTFGQQKGFFGLRQILEALDAEGSSQYANTNLVTEMLRCCYEGHSPPHGILQQALQRFGLPLNQEQKQNSSKLWQYNKKQHILASVIKLALTYESIKKQTKKENWMEELEQNPSDRSQPYRYGMLLAIMEEIQRQAAGGRVNATIVDSFYKSASTMPEMVFGTLFSRMEDRLSQLRKKHGVTGIEKEMESLVAEIAEYGGFAPSLEINEQAEFALGFYHKRANFRADMVKRSKKEKK